MERQFYVMTKFTMSNLYQKIYNWMRNKVCFCIVVPPIWRDDLLSNLQRKCFSFSAFASYICHNFNLANSNLLFTEVTNANFFICMKQSPEHGGCGPLATLCVCRCCATSDKFTTHHIYNLKKNSWQLLELCAIGMVGTNQLFLCYLYIT